MPSTNPCIVVWRWYEVQWWRKSRLEKGLAESIITGGKHTHTLFLLLQTSKPVLSPSKIQLGERALVEHLLMGGRPWI